jgi:TldD protein
MLSSVPDRVADVRGHAIDPAFLDLPRAAVTDAALSRAEALGVEHADVRIGRTRSQSLRLRDGRLEGANDDEDLGVGVRVVLDGTWGFAATETLTADAAARAADDAVELARVSRPVNTERVELAAEPVYADAVWLSDYDVDPFDVPEDDKVSRLVDWSRRLLDADGVDHVDAAVLAVREQKFYADVRGTTTTQQRVRIHAQLDAVTVDKESGRFETMRTLAPPVGRGWEYLVGDGSPGWDWDAELAELPELLAAKLRAVPVEAGRHDLVVDPSNLWLTIHESIGHATELDRALGYEAAYAGTSFATPDKLDTLRYGSPVMNVTGDRIAGHGLSTVGYDDEGVAAQQWDLVRDGVLVGYQLDRRMARATGRERSNGCAYADSPSHIAIQRMPNVSLQPADGGPSTGELISAVDHGLYVVGDKSWSIDMQRYNFQFTGQRFFRIENGRLAGQVRDVAYQSNTLDFWRSLEAVGGPQTYVLGGAFNCGKGQPGQVAAVSHGCPTALFRGVNILNTASEGGR